MMGRMLGFVAVALAALLLGGCATSSVSSGPRTLTLDVSEFLGEDFFENVTQYEEAGGDLEPYIKFFDAAGVALGVGIPYGDIISRGSPEMVISEDMTVDGFTSWECFEALSYPKTEVGIEFGYYSDPRYEGVFGFLLYDGSDKGIRTYYRRTGLEHIWVWTGPYGGSYQFVISGDYGRYYDFTDVPDGESTKPRDVYKVRKR